MATHYLTVPEIFENFSKYITKKEADIQSVGTTITINTDQITIIDDIRYSKMNLFQNEKEKAVGEWFEDK